MWMIGIQRRGVPLAHRLADKIKTFEVDVPVVLRYNII